MATARALGRLTRRARQWPRWLIEFSLELIDADLHALCVSPDHFSPAVSVITARFEGRISEVEFQILMRALGHFRAEMEQLDDRLKEWPYEEAYRCARRLKDKNRPRSLSGPFHLWPEYERNRNQDSFLGFYKYLSLKPRPVISFVTVEPESEGALYGIALDVTSQCRDEIEKKEHWISKGISKERVRRWNREEKSAREEDEREITYLEEPVKDFGEGPGAEKREALRAVHQALFRPQALTEDERERVEPNWKVLGTQVGLKESDRELLERRVRGDVTRNGNGAAYKRLQRAFPKMRRRIKTSSSSETRWKNQSSWSVVHERLPSGRRVWTHTDNLDL